MPSIVLDKNKVSKHFIPFLESTARLQILMGGRGSSKTHSIIIKLILFSYLNIYNRIVYVNKEYRHISTQQYSSIKSVAKSLNIYDDFKFYDGTYKIVNKITGVEFIPIGMDDFEKTKGIDNPTIIWWDEISKGTLNDFLALNALLRTPLNPIHQFIGSFNPVSERHWLRKYFFDEHDPYKLKAEFKNSYLNHSTYLDNDFINKDEYLKTLQQNALGNQNRRLVDIEGRWGIEMLDNIFLYSFDKQRHYVDDYYNLIQGSNLILSFDFNKTPCTLLVIHIDRYKNTNIIDLIFADENTMENATPLEAICRRFKEKYKGFVTSANILVTGDASGQSGGADQKKNQNFFTTIQHELMINKYQIKLRKKNITHKESQEICNTFVYNCGFKIYKSAEKLIDEIELAYMASTGNNENLDKAKKEYGLHAFDTLRYGIDCVLNFKEWKNYIEYYRK